MIGWSGIDAVAAAFSSVPERWASTIRLLPPDDSAPPPTRDEVVEAFNVVETALSGLGPPDDDEPVWALVLNEDLLHQAGFAQRFPDRRSIDGPSMRAHIASINEAPRCNGMQSEVSWRGLLRAWLRAQLGFLTQVVVMDVPPFYGDDPDQLRELAFSRVQRIALMLSDGHQASVLSLIADRVEMAAEPLAARLYHHQNAGPKVKAVLDEIFEDWVVERIKAKVPATHDPPRWKGAV